MRDVPASISTTWVDGAFIGDRRPIARVTIAHPTMTLRNFSLLSSYTEKISKISKDPTKSTVPTVTIDVDHGQKVNQTYADFLFTTMGAPMELPNVKSVSWQRTIDADVADCTIECWNTKPLPIGVVPRPGELDEPGYYTYSRGGSAFSSRWMHQRNEWFGMIAPDNILRTYEGYGFDDKFPPDRDPHLIQTGVWIIDTVEMNANGTMNIKARDLGRILMDQMFYEPVVPKQFYDVGFQNWTGIYERDPDTTKLSVGALKVAGLTSSNYPWIASGTVQGHTIAHAFDGNPNTYWLSIGNDRPSRRFAYEWVQCSIGHQSVSEVWVRTKKKGYTAYVSVMVAGVWQGAATINYHEDGIGQNGGDIKYVAAALITTESTVKIKFKALKKVQAVRVTLGNLQDFGFGPYRYRGGIRDVEVHNSTTTVVAGKDRQGKKGPAGANPGRYDDYCADEDTEIFTRRGWLRYDQVDAGDETLSIDPDTGFSSWETIKDVYRKHRVERDMVAMESTVHSSLTTPNHRWLVTDQAGQRHWRTTETLKTGHRIPLSAPRADHPTVKKYDDAIVELVAWFYTEGWMGGPRQGVSLAQSDVVHPDHVQRIRAALVHLWGPASARRSRQDRPTWVEKRRPDGVVTFSLSATAAREVLNLAPDKVPSPDFLTHLTQEQLTLFIDVSIWADGWTRGTRRFFGQNRGPRLDAFLFACALAGQATSVSGKDCADVTLLQADTHLPVNAARQAAGRAHITPVTYTGIVWCPTLSRNHNWLARRHDTIYFTGNTDLIKLFCAWGGFFWPAGGRVRHGDVHIAANAVDDDPATYWQSDYPGTAKLFTLDLGARRTIRQLIVRMPPTWPARTQHIEVFTSRDNKKFTLADAARTYTFDPATGSNARIVLGADISTRWVRLKLSANSLTAAVQLGALEVYPDATQPPAGANMALGYPVVANSTLPSYTTLEPLTYDWKVLGKGVKGRIWGDFEQTGTNGPVALAADNFDKKSLMECIGYIRDILGFIFFIDETGGVQWRFPNIQDRGCMRSTLSANPGFQAGFAHQIDENTVLMTLTCTIDSKNVREGVFVGDILGKIGAFAPGFNPNPTGLRRIAGWTDTNFSDGINGKGKDAEKQCELMADLISLRQLFTYRTDRVRIPANPAIQIDDQVRIFERTTAEGYLHYVKGIASSLDISTGEWTYDLDTHWLGYDPASTWIYKPQQLLETTKAYLAALAARRKEMDKISRIQYRED